jgi:hypothetical protein
MNISSLCDRRKNKRLLASGLEIHDSLIDKTDYYHPKELEFYYQLFPRFDIIIDKPLVVMNIVRRTNK